MKFNVDYSWKDINRAFWVLLRLDLGLTIAFYVIHILAANISLGPLRPWFDLDSDTSIPCWYSSIKLFLVACCIFIASQNNSYKRYLPSSWLFFLGFGFLFLSMDEGAAIHEHLSETARTLKLDWLLIGGHGAWIILYAVLAFPLLLLSLRYLKMMWKYFQNETIKAFIGFVILCSGGVVVEVIGYFFLRSDLTSTSYKISVLIEESLEMVGVSIILYSMMLLSLSLSSKNTAGDSSSPLPKSSIQ